MKSATTGTVSGCIIWFLVFGMISMCVLPVAMTMGGITSASNYAVKITGGFICPAGSTPTTYSYATTTTDEYGNRQPSTAYVLQCVDANQETVKEDPVGYAFLWIGILCGIGLVIAGILAFVFAAPAGVLIARIFNRNKNNSMSNIEPR